MPRRLDPQKTEAILTWIRGLTSITEDPGSLVAAAAEAGEAWEANAETPPSDLDPTEVPAQSSDDAGTDIDPASSPSSDGSVPGRRAPEASLAGIPEEVRQQIIADPDLGSQDLANIALTSKALNSSVSSVLEERRALAAIKNANTERELITLIDSIQNTDNHNFRAARLVQAAGRAGRFSDQRPGFQRIYDCAVALRTRHRTSPLCALAYMAPNMIEADQQWAIDRIKEAKQELLAEHQTTLQEALDHARNSTMAVIREVMPSGANEAGMAYARRLHAAYPHLTKPRLSDLSGIMVRHLHRDSAFREVPAEIRAIAAAMPRAAGETGMAYAHRLHAAHPNLTIPKLSELSGVMVRNLQQTFGFEGG